MESTSTANADLDRDFTDFVQARWTRLVRTAYLMGCPTDQAEDVAQSALLMAYRHWRRVKGAASPDAYLSTILLNELRKNRRRRPPLTSLSMAPEPTLASPADRVIAGIDLTSMLDRLPPEQRTVLVLRYFTDLSVQDTAEVLGVPAGTVKSRSARAIEAVRALMAMQEGNHQHE